MNDKDIISTLNDLIGTSKDGEEGFRVCAEEIRDAQLKTALVQRSVECSTAVRELQQLVRSLGGEPETSSTIGGVLHRQWLDIKSLVTGKDNLAILNECERGEDVALKNYRQALEQNLPEEIRSIVEKQFLGVQRNHERVKNWRDSEQAAKNLAR